MEVPNTLKTNVRLVLLSKPRGIFLDNLCEEFQCLVNKPLQYLHLGYRSLQDFIRAIPDAARLDFSAKDQHMKVYGVLPPKAAKPGMEPTVQVKQELIDSEFMDCSRAEANRSHVNPLNTSLSLHPGARDGVHTGLAVSVNQSTASADSVRGSAVNPTPGILFGKGGAARAEISPSSAVNPTSVGIRRTAVGTGVCTSGANGKGGAMDCGTGIGVFTSSGTGSAKDCGTGISVFTSSGTGSVMDCGAEIGVFTSSGNGGAMDSTAGTGVFTGGAAVSVNLVARGSTDCSVNFGARTNVGFGSKLNTTAGSGIGPSSSLDARSRIRSGFGTTGGGISHQAASGGTARYNSNPRATRDVDIGGAVNPVVTTGFGTGGMTSGGTGRSPGFNAKSCARVKVTMSSLSPTGGTGVNTSRKVNQSPRSGVGVSSVGNSSAGIGVSTGRATLNPATIRTGVTEIRNAANPGTRSGGGPPPPHRNLVTTGVASRGGNGAADTDRGPGTSAGNSTQSGVNIDVDSKDMPLITADHRGFYSLGFRAKNKPDIPGSLTEFFSLAGKVAEVEEPQKSGFMYHPFIFVRYYDAESAMRAYKMFAHIGMKPSSPFLPPPGQTALTPAIQKERNIKRRIAQVSDSTSNHRPVKRIKNRGKRFNFKEEGPCYRVHLRNLDPTLPYTLTMFFDLFKDYPVGWVKLRPAQMDDKSYLSAFVLLPNRQLAEKLVAEFNGFVWMGRALELHIRDRQTDTLKRAMEAAADGRNTTYDSSLPELIYPEDMPGLESWLPELEPRMPGLEEAMPGLEPDMPGLEPSMPSLESDMPGLEPIPGLPNFRVQRKVDTKPVGHVPLIIVTKFMEYVTERDLRRHFAGYGVRSVEILPTAMGRKKALVQVDSLENVKRAVYDMNKRPYFGGLRLRLDIDFYTPASEEAGTERTLTQGEMQLQTQAQTQSQARAHLQTQSKAPAQLQTHAQRPVQAPARLQLQTQSKAPAQLQTHAQRPVQAPARMQRQTLGHAPAQLQKHATRPVQASAWMQIQPAKVPGQRHLPTQDQTQTEMQLQTHVQAQAQAQTTGDGSLTVSDTLKMRCTCLQILQVPEIHLHIGQQVKVLVTTVISNSFFWGQIVDEDSMEELQKISGDLNESEEHMETAAGPGRCKALFQGDWQWYRAWAIQGREDEDMVRVFYLDYGNTALIPWYHTAKNTKPSVWSLQPMAVPFTLTEPVTNLKTKEMTQLTVEVKARGTLEEGNMVVVRAISLIPDVKQYIARIGETIIM